MVKPTRMNRSTGTSACLASITISASVNLTVIRFLTRCKESGPTSCLFECDFGRFRLWRNKWGIFPICFRRIQIAFRSASLHVGECLRRHAELVLGQVAAMQVERGDVIDGMVVVAGREWLGMDRHSSLLAGKIPIPPIQNHALVKLY